MQRKKPRIGTVFQEPSKKIKRKRKIKIKREKEKQVSLASPSGSAYILRARMGLTLTDDLDV
jgi:hypothetical protein